MPFKLKDSNGNISDILPTMEEALALVEDWKLTYDDLYVPELSYISLFELSTPLPEEIYEELVLRFEHITTPNNDFGWVQKKRSQIPTIFETRPKYLRSDGVLFETVEHFQIPVREERELVQYFNEYDLRESVYNQNLNFLSEDFLSKSEKFHCLSISELENQLRAAWFARMKSLKTRIFSLSGVISRLEQSTSSLFSTFEMNKNSAFIYADPQYSPEASYLMFNFAVDKRVFRPNGSIFPMTDIVIEETDTYVRRELRKFHQVNGGRSIPYDTFDFSKREEDIGYKTSTKSNFIHTFFIHTFLIARNSFRNPSELKLQIERIKQDLLLSLKADLEEFNEEYRILNEGFSYAYINQVFLDI